MKCHWKFIWIWKGFWLCCRTFYHRHKLSTTCQIVLDNDDMISKWKVRIIFPISTWKSSKSSFSFFQIGTLKTSWSICPHWSHLEMDVDSSDLLRSQPFGKVKVNKTFFRQIRKVGQRMQAKNGFEQWKTVLKLTTNQTSVKANPPDSVQGVQESSWLGQAWL